MTNLLLIRHGDTGLYGDAQKPDTALNKVGNNQVAALARCLGNLNVIDQLFVSPYKRASESGQLIAGELGIKAKKDKRLIEIDLWENPIYMKEDPNFDAALERFNTDQIRVGEVLEELTNKYINQTVAAVGHGNWIRAALGYAIGMDVESLVRLSVPLASVNSLTYDDRGFYIMRRFGWTVS